jgi:hypothetical protein
MQNTGKYIVVAGVILIVTGLIIWLLGNKLSWFGSLPGDIKIKREHFTFYAPFVSMLILSLVISLVIWFIKKIF